MHLLHWIKVILDFRSMGSVDLPGARGQQNNTKSKILAHCGTVGSTSLQSACTCMCRHIYNWCIHLSRSLYLNLHVTLNNQSFSLAHSKGHELVHCPFKANLLIIQFETKTCGTLGIQSNIIHNILMDKIKDTEYFTILFYKMQENFLFGNCKSYSCCILVGFPTLNKVQ